MGQALYRKNRPKSLDDVIGQAHIITTLKNALKTGKISHAYLFTGPRGVGKTSVARILAHEVNKLPYNEESTHIDIIEIDAASNRRIDEVRDLRDKVHISPTSSKYKVYIIDEVHMLTKEAFNALLKTLEEPPAHVIFILATTEAHKLPETIISRTQRFSFKPIENQQAVQRLRQMAKAENINIDDEALALIAEHGEGSFRDSISLLDQASSSDKMVSTQVIERMLGIAPLTALQSLTEALSSASPQELLQLLTELREQGYQSVNLAKQLGKTLREQLIAGKPILPASQTSELLKQLLEVAGSPQSDRLLEIILLDIVLRNTNDENLTKTIPEVPKITIEPTIKIPVEANKAKPKPTITKRTPANSSLTLDDWSNILGEVKKKHSTLYSMLRMAQPDLDGDTLTLTFQFIFHQKHVSESKNQLLLNDIINNYSKNPISIKFKARANKNTKPDPKSTTPVETINSIFGGSEVLES